MLLPGSGLPADSTPPSTISTTGGIPTGPATPFTALPFTILSVLGYLGDFYHTGEGVLGDAVHRACLEDTTACRVMAYLPGMPLGALLLE